MDEEDLPKVNFVVAHCSIGSCNWESSRVPVGNTPNALWFARRDASFEFNRHLDDQHRPSIRPYWEEII